MMQLTSLSRTAPAGEPGCVSARRLNQPGSVNPSIDSEPACKKSRRLQPSQKETLRSASIRSMVRSPPGNSQEPRTKFQEPRAKFQESRANVILEFGSWKLVLELDVR